MTPPLLALSGPVPRQVNTLIEEAIRLRASDIHIEPFEQHVHIRVRVDGHLARVGQIELANKDVIVSRIKIMANLDIAEKRRPQDGRIRFVMSDRQVDIRVSIIPTVFGEKIVLRILDRSGVNLNLDALGLSVDQCALLIEKLDLPYGMILVSGPTGSGKTTTLYAGLNHLNSDHVNISTIEDPIEYNLVGVNQTQVNPDIDVTFANALRSMLRQDPNVIMVGEMRDRLTVEIAIQASLTGHLVLSTIHTNDSPSTLTRLIDMGVEPFLIESSLRLVVAQRLVRRVCPDCSEPVTIESKEWAEQIGAGHYHAGQGCASCLQTGYRGRIALFELMPLESGMDRIRKEDAEQVYRQIMRDRGIKSLRESGLERIREGVTTPQEVWRETAE